MNLAQVIRISLTTNTWLLLLVGEDNKFSKSFDQVSVCLTSVDELWLQLLGQAKVYHPACMCF